MRGDILAYEAQDGIFYNFTFCLTQYIVFRQSLGYLKAPLL